ncbi:MAG: family 16 glycosylhydrolase [Marinilabilia sp.]
MKKFLHILFLILVSQVSLEAQDCSYKVFSDDFEYEGEPDPDHWNYETGGGGWGNNELQEYTDDRDNSYVSNGTLKIHARKSSSGKWTSARMVTSGKASWSYGRFEIRAKLPEGVGTWPAIWMMPQNSEYGTWPKSGEIDIMEHVGYDPGMVHGSIHTEAFNHKDGTQKGGSIEVSDAQDEFHVYSIEWTPDEIRWFVDDEQYFSFSNKNISYKEWPFDKEFFLILNIAIGGDWGAVEGIDPDLEEAVMEIDYVRVYKDSLPDFSVEGPERAREGEEVRFSVPGFIDEAEYQWEIPDDAEILSGQNSNEISVKWGESSGEVICKMITECEEKTGNSQKVKLSLKPGEAPFVLSSVNADTTAWTVPKQDHGNSFSLQEDGEHTRVNFSIDRPAANPYVSMPLSFSGDFSEFRSVELPIKIMKGEAPNVLRMDFIDSKGRVNTSDLFKIDKPVVNNHYHIYTHTFSGSSSRWSMEEIEEVRLYVNYGLSGREGDGSFVVGDVKLGPEGHFIEPETPSGENFSVTTETGEDGWQVSEEASDDLSVTGGDQLNINYPFIEASGDNFIEIRFPRPVDLHAYSRLNIEFAEDGQWPDEMEVAIIDRNDQFNEDDLFTTDDFSFPDENTKLSYDYGKVDDGGDFLPCRVKALRIWVDSGYGNSEAVDFSINDIFFSEFSPGSGIFDEKKNFEVEIWPNPASNFVYLENVNSEFDSWQIYSMEGRKVAEGELNGQGNKLDVSNLFQGYFVLSLRSNRGEHYTKKIRIIR